MSIAIEKLRKQIYELYKNRDFSKDKLNSLLKDYADKYIFGCDIDPLLYRISKSYMAIVGDGKSNIYNFDSLEPYDCLDANFCKRIKPGTVDIITTNPPFGTKIDDTRDFVLEQYDLGHKLSDGVATKTLLDGQDPDKLFVERDLFYLKNATASKDGGRMVIVLPKQNLSGAQEESIEFRKWLLKKVQITAIVDLPREAFQPHTGTKTSLVFMKKVNKKGIEEVSNDPIILSSLGNAEYENYFRNLMYRLVLHGTSHREEQVKSMHDLTFFTVISESEKRRTARDILCFIFLLNKAHLLAHLSPFDQDAETTLGAWCQEIKERSIKGI